MKKVEFVLEGKHKPFACDVRYQADNSKKAIVLFVHGFKGFKDAMHFNAIADEFANAGFVYVKINLSHNGTNLDNSLEFVDLESFGNC